MKNGKCKLCLQEKPLLKKSHIIPDFFYVQADMYNQNHQIHKIDVQKFLKNKHISFVPTGIYDQGILCKECDNNIIGILETYGRKVLFGGLNPDEQINCLNFNNPIDGFEFSIVENVDYKKFKLFLLSILWRSAVSSNDFFKDVNFLENYMETLRKMIFEGLPGKFNDFPIITMSYIKDKSVPADFIGQPIKAETEKGITITFLLAGFVFMFSVKTDFVDINRIENLTPTPDNKFGIMHFPIGQGWDFILKYTNIKE